MLETCCCHLLLGFSCVLFCGFVVLGVAASHGFGQLPAPETTVWQVLFIP
jgi:hypothetical protein